MHVVIGVLVAAFVVALVVGLITGRARVDSCCRYVPPERDARLGPRTSPSASPSAPDATG